MLTSPAPVVDLVRRRREPVVVRTLRSTAGVVLAYLAGLWLSGNAQPLLAPLTALLVVQVTPYATLTLGIRRIASVVAGVLIAVGFADAVGRPDGASNCSSWPASRSATCCIWPPGGGGRRHGHARPRRGGQRTEAIGRVIETLMGATLGVLLNPVVAPPVYVGPAGEATWDLAARLRLLLLRIGDELVHGASARHVTAWPEEARRVDHQTADVDAALARAEESLRLNPRGRPAPGTRLVLRSGLDAMEYCVVGLRSLCRTFADLRLMNELEIDRRLRASHTEDRTEARRRRDRTSWEVCCVRCGPANCGGGGAVAWIRADAGRSAAPDDEEHIASWEEQCGTGH
ncbi:aromatic acid exporter family protein [Streptomyces sp. NPDC004008]